jgi:ParB-like nuclease domain
MNAVNNPEVEWQVRRIPLDAIQVDPTVQQRAAGTSQDVVDDYAEAMRDGVAFPPIDVFGYDDGPFHLGNGFHRLDAFRLAHPDAKDIECKVHPGDRDDALLFACSANAQHGLRRTRSDKLRAVTTLLSSERWSGWSDREIARQCAVSHTYVAAVRSEHLATFPDARPEQEAAAETPPAPNTAAPVRRRTVRRRGKRYKLATARIGRGRSQPQDGVAKLKRALERFQRVLSGASEPARKTFVEHCREEIMALANAPEPPNPEAPNREPPNPEAPSHAEVESSTVPPARARAYGVAKTSRLTRGSAPNKSHKNAPGRHRFSSDNQPPRAKRGRPKGSPNTLGLSLRQIIIQAGENVGNVGEDKDGNRINGEGGMLGYVEWLARNEPKSYAVLLRGVMPAEIRATMTLRPMLTFEEACAEMRARGLPMELIENLHRLDDELGPDDEPNPYDRNVIDLKPDPPEDQAV